MRLEKRVTDDNALADELRPRGPVELSIDGRIEDGQMRLVLSGELDILTAGQLSGRLSDVVRGELGDLEVDLRELRFIDSTGLHILLNAHRRLTRRGRRLTIRCRPGPVARAIELARLSQTLGVVLSDPRPDPDAMPPPR